MTRPVGFAFRLQRGALIGWTVALFLLGFVYGSIANDIEQMIEENEFAADMFAAQGGAGLTDQFLAAAMAQLALIAGACGIASALRLATEEATGRAEPLLASPTSRWRWAASHLLMAAAGSLIAVAAAGVGVGVAYAVVTSDAGQIPRMIAAALVTYPAVLVLTGIAAAFFGLFPSMPRAAWGALAITFVTGFFGELVRLPEWTLRISPFDHVPGLPAEDLSVAPLFVLTAIALGLIALGMWRFGERDLRTE